ncbi:MAG TPA: phosphoesterase [Pirellulales bacterium]|nr:phosphoesterase [Pirellulales bacterium]
MTQVQSECVLVVPTQLFHSLGHFQGFSPDADRYLDTLLDAKQLSFRPRSEVEEDPSFKQLIPYVIFRHSDTKGRTQLFQYTRGKGQGEGRLHAKMSIGIGGHIAEGDGGLDSAQSPQAVYAEGMRRELAEEVAIEAPYRDRRVGLINDDQSEVGKVHLGVVHLFEVEQPRVRPLEVDILEAGFRGVDEILSRAADFETWSQICLQALFAK